MRKVIGIGISAVLIGILLPLVAAYYHFVVKVTDPVFSMVVTGSAVLGLISLALGVFLLLKRKQY